VKRSIIAVVLIALNAAAQTNTSNVVHLEVLLNHGQKAYVVNGTKIPASEDLLNVLREAPHENGRGVLDVFLHSPDTSIRDIFEVSATVDKQGTYAELHFFVRCYNANRPAWCELEIGKPEFKPNVN